MRRRDLLLACACAAVPLAAGRGAGLALAQGRRAPGWIGAGLARDPASGELLAVFGLDVATATEVLLRATRLDALPEGYAPPDLVMASAHGMAAAGRQTLRAVVAPDTRGLLDAAAAEGIDLYVGSGFRSQAYQADVFAAQVARWGDEDTANRYSARPGHSQHQLGTTIDFTNDFRAFRGAGAGTWLRDNAHRFGFVLPYTAASTALTGYIDEPWHGRWVGQPLASQLQAAGYQDWTDLTADDIVAAIRAEARLDG